jgi:MFS transporter, OFA family, oxalate/formate antiporter
MMASRRWAIIGTLFLSSVIMMGAGVNTFGVFFDSLMQEFGRSHAQVALLFSLVILMIGLVGPVCGWLFEKFQARMIMGAGTLVSTAGFVVASRSASYGVTVLAYILVGLGLGFCTMTAISVVVANSIDPSERGKAMGIAMSGNGAGGFLMIPVASFALAHFGWREAYLIITAPMILILLPLLLLFIRSGPRQKTALNMTTADEGLELREAIRGRSLWLILGATFLTCATVSTMHVHLIPYLIQLGYRPDRAATSLSIIQGITCGGTIVWGFMVDRLGARTIMFTTPLVAAASYLILLMAAEPSSLVTFIILFGLILNSYAAVMPLVLAESLGLRRFALFSGIGMFTLLMASASGPFVAGWIIDLTGRYSSAFVVDAVASLFASVLVLVIPHARFRVAAVPLDA